MPWKLCEKTKMLQFHFLICNKQFWIEILLFFKIQFKILVVIWPETCHICNNLCRLENMRSEFHWIKNKANVFKTMGMVYKQKLETKSSDLSKAEAEVCNQKHYCFLFFCPAIGNIAQLCVSESYFMLMLITT